MSTVAETHSPRMDVLTSGFAAAAPRPVVWLAAVGILSTLYGLYGALGWVTSADFAPIDPGPDPLPTASRVLILFFEVFGPLAAIGMFVYAWRTSAREGRLSIEAIIILAWMSCYWQDPMINWYRTIFFYNSHFTNMGNWSTHLLGWVNPGGRGLPEPLLAMGLAYVWAPLWIGLLGRSILRRARDRWPELTSLRLVALLVVAMMVLDLVVETILIRVGLLWAYPGAIRALTLWAGEIYQFPLYESVLWAPCWALSGCILFFRDDRGNTLIERGIDRVKSVRLHSPLRLFAMIGVINLAFLYYNASMLFLSFYVDSTPAGYPSWLLNGMCGAETAYECPGPDVHVALPESGPVPPFSGRN